MAIELAFQKFDQWQPKQHVEFRKKVSLPPDLPYIIAINLPFQKLYEWQLMQQDELRKSQHTAKFASEMAKELPFEKLCQWQEELLNSLLTVKFTVQNGDRKWKYD
jgi:hypothetical protein